MDDLAIGFAPQSAPTSGIDEFELRLLPPASDGIESFRCAPGSWRFWLVGDRVLSAVEAVDVEPGQDATVQLVAQETTRFVGEVYDSASGAPVADALVTATFWRGLVSARSGVDGRFVIESFPSTGSAIRLGIEADGFASEHARVYRHGEEWVLLASSGGEGAMNRASGPARDAHELGAAVRPRPGRAGPAPGLSFGLSAEVVIVGRLSPSASEVEGRASSLLALDPQLWTRRDLDVESSGARGFETGFEIRSVHPRAATLVQFRAADGSFARRIVAPSAERRIDLGLVDLRESPVCRVLGVPREASKLSWVVTLGQVEGFPAWREVGELPVSDADRGGSVEVPLPDGRAVFEARDPEGRLLARGSAQVAAGRACEALLELVER